MVRAVAVAAVPAPKSFRKERLLIFFSMCLTCLFYLVYFVPFHIDSGEGPGWAEVLAGSAPDATFRVDSRDLHFPVRGLVGNHVDGPVWAMATAVAAFYAIAEDDTVLLDPYGMPYVDGRLVLSLDQLDGSCWADLGAARAFWAAPASFIAHDRLHQSHKSS
jgi:hypothetical protein